MKQYNWTHEEIWQDEIDKKQKDTCGLLTRIKLYLAAGFVILGIFLTVLDYLTCKAEAEIRYNMCALRLMTQRSFNKDVCYFNVKPANCHYTVEDIDKYIDDLCK